MIKKLYDKCITWAGYKYAKQILAIEAFIESSFFPIPPDVMIIPMVVSKRNQFVQIAFIATIFSVGFFLKGRVSSFTDFMIANSKHSGIRSIWRGPFVTIEVMRVDSRVINRRCCRGNCKNRRWGGPAVTWYRASSSARKSSLS